MSTIGLVSSFGAVSYLTYMMIRDNMCGSEEGELMCSDGYDFENERKVIEQTVVAEENRQPKVRIISKRQGRFKAVLIPKNKGQRKKFHKPTRARAVVERLIKDQ